MPPNSPEPGVGFCHGSAEDPPAQALSGTGALRVVGHFMNLNLGTKTVWMSDPTWGNHKASRVLRERVCVEFSVFFARWR